MQHIDFSSWFTSYQQQALMLNERRLIILVGDNIWASTLVKSIDRFNTMGESDGKNTWFIYGDSGNIKPNVALQRFRDKLGSESNFVLFQDANLSIDAFACLSGTLLAGGVFFLCISDISKITESLFYQRFIRLVKRFPEHVFIEQDQCLLPALMANKSVSTGEVLNSPDTSLACHCVTKEQVNAVESVIKVCKGKRNKPLVLTADRGRGKSSALAIACAALLKAATKHNTLTLVITAADISALTVFFNRLVNCLPEGEFRDGKFSVMYGSVEFVPVDQLMKQSVNASLLLIDEAAAIPIYLLEALLSISTRLVFSTTIHGYEGAGRGFTLKFQKTLAARYPKWQSLHMHEPIRWAVNDPLERLVFEACLLNAELPKIKGDWQSNDLSSLTFKQFSATELASDEALFKQVFSVLVTAHYQTKPSDVKMILDNNQVQLVCLLSQKGINTQVVAVALLINEGCASHHAIDTAQVSAIKQSKRRLRNHFVPQSLLTQCGIEQAFDYSYIRVMRIAVHPELQHQKIGSTFLERITDFAKLQGADFLASSFGVTHTLLSFWLVNDFQLARIGFKKDKASGEQSALVLKALSNTGNSALNHVNLSFYRSFDYLLTDEYKRLPPALVALILFYCPKKSCNELTQGDKENIIAFANGYRQYSSCVFSLHLWLKLVFSGSGKYLDDGLYVFISRIFQKQSVEDTCKQYGFTGKKALELFLRSKVKQFL